MSDPAGGPVDRTASAIAFVCTHLADLRAQLTRLGDTGPLEQLLARLAAGDDPAAALDRLHDTLLAGGDVLGVYGSGTRSWSVHVAGAGTTAPAETLYVCPLRRCARYRWADAGGTAPACTIGGAPMRRERLG
ncbi:hypothetical protein GCM10010399_93870 [Dactylosporangium fulvum]|uniref:Uncharacterized protein n=1 Tax=Dactylosporangium fulvum TaxID=53359 RepID=A0ABY5VPY1_9ACTN|nr:hypothetical protein [Dactylosporangium fulvum]UWP79159.1 hypothetical protein Dfulv_28780 [Dactylosporangium fulvum]